MKMRTLKRCVLPVCEFPILAQAHIHFVKVFVPSARTCLVIFVMMVAQGSPCASFDGWLPIALAQIQYLICGLQSQLQHRSVCAGKRVISLHDALGYDDCANSLDVQSCVPEEVSLQDLPIISSESRVIENVTVLCSEYAVGDESQFVCELPELYCDVLGTSTSPSCNEKSTDKPPDAPKFSAHGEYCEGLRLKPFDEPTNKYCEVLYAAERAVPSNHDSQGDEWLKVTLGAVTSALSEVFDNPAFGVT